LNKALTDNELDHLLNFIGYGRLDADIWFLGPEETGGDERKIRDRLNFQQVEDSDQAQKTLGASLHQFGEENLLGAWRGMCEIMLTLEGRQPSSENIRSYRAENLGRAQGSTLLCELLPIPMPIGSLWGYDTLLPQYPSRQAYNAAVKPLRFEFFRQLIKQNPPKIIVAYDQSAWPDYQELFRGFNLVPSGQFEMGWDANTVVILSEHFSAETMKGKYEQLVRLILENSLSIETAKPTGPIPLSKAELARQKKESAKQASAARRKPTTRHNPSDPYCVCAFCLGYEND
jgi:hypothetical protein